MPCLLLSDVEKKISSDSLQNPPYHQSSLVSPINRFGAPPASFLVLNQRCLIRLLSVRRSACPALGRPFIVAILVISPLSGHPHRSAHSRHPRRLHVVSRGIFPSICMSVKPPCIHGTVSQRPCIHGLVSQKALVYTVFQNVPPSTSCPYLRPVF